MGIDYYALTYKGLGHPCLTPEGNSRLRSERFPGSFRFFPELVPGSPSRTGGVAH